MRHRITRAGVIAVLIAGAIERVLMNLLSNAPRHTPHDGSVAVRVTSTDGAVLVMVEDTGNGIPEGGARFAFTLPAA